MMRRGAWRSNWMKLQVFGAALLVAGLPAAVMAQTDSSEVRFGSSPNPVGSGARALGIGSAFIATADDATAASWNPGGLIALEKPEVSLVLDLKRRVEIYDGPGVAAENRNQALTYPGINYFSVAYPFKVRHRFFVASLNFQSLIDFEKRMRITRVVADEDFLRSSETTFRERGRLRAIAPALAFQISPQIAVGFTMAFWTDKLGYQNGWTDRRRARSTTTIGGNTFLSDTLLRQEFSFNGFGGNVGVIWDITPQWTVGAVAKTPVWGTARRQLLELRSTNYDTDGNVIGTPSEVEPISFDESMRMPPSYGAGVAYRHSDALTISADIYRTEWGLFLRGDTDPVNGAHRAINPISGDGYKKSNVSGTIQAHVGAEYLVIFPRTVVPVRGGLFYDPEPRAEGLEHVLGFALGTGVSIGPMIVDLAYQMRWGPNANPNVLGGDTSDVDAVVMSTGGSVLQHAFYLSGIYHL